MNKIMAVTILAGLFGTAFVISNGARSQTNDGATPTAETLNTDLKQYLSDVKALKKSYENKLTALNKEKGYDPKIYDLIADADNILTNVGQNTKDLKTNADAINKEMSDVNDLIVKIQSMNPDVPTTFPGKCVTYKNYSVQGWIDTLAGKWVFKTLVVDQVKYYPFSPNVGWTDGNPAILSRTIQGRLDTAYLEGGQVVCLDPISQ